jgi:RimJ/RimL family protein N-acetyltransferase
MLRRLFGDKTRFAIEIGEFCEETGHLRRVDAWAAERCDVALGAFLETTMNDVRLRAVEESDLPIFFEQQLDPEARRMAAFRSRPYDAFMAHWQKVLADETAIVRTIVFQDHAAGNIVCWKADGEWMIGYWLGKDYWGRGIATAALMQFLDVVQARPLLARVAKQNGASIRVLQKCGFTICGQDTFVGPEGEPAEELILTRTGTGMILVGDRA